MIPELALHDAFDGVPVNQFLQLRLEQRSGEHCRASAAIRPEYTQEHGVVHGAIITALADTAAVWLFHPALADGESMASIEFKVNFLAPAFIDRGPLIAEAQLVRRGRRVGVAQADVLQGTAHVARGLFTYMFFARDRG